MPTPYEILGISREATDLQIKAAFRTKSKTAHPDAGGDPDEFAILKKAYDTLMDHDARAYFDKTGNAEFGAIRAEAMREIARMVTHLMASPAGVLAVCDMVETMKEMRRSTAQTMCESIANVEVILNNCAIASKRLKKKSGHDSPMVEIIERHAVKMRTLKQENERWLIVLDEVERILKNTTDDGVLKQIGNGKNRGGAVGPGGFFFFGR